MSNPIDEKIDKLKRQISLAEQNLKSNINELEISDMYYTMTNTKAVKSIGSNPAIAMNSTVLDTLLKNSGLIKKAFDIYQILNKFKSFRK